MAKNNRKPQKKTAKGSRERALNAFDTAADDEYYIKGLRQQQDIDLEHVADDRIRDLLNNVVNPEDDEEIDSDEAMGSASDISLGEPDSGDEDEWGDSLDEAELLPLSEVWDVNDELEGGDSSKKETKASSKPDVPVSKRGSAAESEPESDSDSLSESQSSSGSDADSESESGSEDSVGLSDSDVENESEDEEESMALRQAIRNISNGQDLGPANTRLVEAAEENPFALPGTTAASGIALEDILPEAQKGKTLSVPAPKRVQERADRSAAYTLARAEVNKWSDTVQANRQAEHLQFPINAPPKLEAASPFALPEPRPSSGGDSLEAKVNQILQSSALADENAASTFEEMAPSKLSIEDLRKRRQELRYMRDLMFREEQRAKRIRKIKSKTYRKIHKKERQKMAELAGDAEDDEEGHSETERAERDRALERATLRHKSTNSKWAKRLLDQGLTRDASTRAELEEMLRQSDALRQKIRGNDQDEDSDDYMDQEGLEAELDAEDAPSAKGVLGMKFMQDAEKKHREQNRKMLNDDYDSDNENENAGRRSFNPAGQQLKRDMEAMAQNSDYSEGEEDGGIQAVRKKTKTRDSDKPRTRDSDKPARGEETIEFRPQVPEPRSGKPKQAKQATQHKTQPEQEKSIEENPWLVASAKSSVPGTVKLASASKNPESLQPKKGRSKDSIVVENTFGDSLVREKDLTLQQQDLVKQAFAGDDVVSEFSASKQAEISEDDDKEIDETLPGWGTWSNEKPRVQKVRKVAGIKEKQRKDYNKSNVIINEKVNKKAAKYNASAVPFPFENRQQYERSLRMPIGQEWVSKDTFQRQTKPRVLVKRGAVIEPIKKPRFNH